MKIFPRDIAIRFGVQLFPGIRQNHLGQDYQEGRNAHGDTVFVDATDSRTVSFTDGSFVRDTLHVVISEDGVKYRAGQRPGSEGARVEKKQVIPLRYFTRDDHGITRPVG